MKVNPYQLQTTCDILIEEMASQIWDRNFRRINKKNPILIVYYLKQILFERNGIFMIGIWLLLEVIDTA